MHNHYANLLAQAEKLRRHNRQGSYKTKERYYEAFKRFLRFVAEEYRLEKLQNLSAKHMHSYFEYLKAKGLAASTIKTEASAIRFWHDQIPNAKHKLPSNDDLSLERRKFGGVDRTWSQSEYNNIILECFGAQRQDYEACIVIARHAGLRIHEVMKIDTAIARDALKTGKITIKGKGGRVRSVPINEQIRIELDSFLKITKPGQKLFVPEDKDTHTVIKEFQRFIRKHRQRIPPPDSGRTAKLTFHGLRPD
jgi:site-specific recombinase XerC